jgi:hypothetical protein
VEEAAVSVERQGDEPDGEGRTEKEGQSDDDPRPKERGVDPGVKRAKHGPRSLLYLAARIFPYDARVPTEPLETHELREKLEEAREHAEHGHRGGETWTLYLSLSTAIIAVFAAVGSLESGANESRALLAKNEAILAQSKATDQWTYFQAKGTKAALFEVQSEVAPTPEVAAKLAARQERYKKEQEEIEREARALEEDVKKRDAEGEEYFHHHHRFALGVTIFQVSIALSAIAALTRRKQLWWVSMVVGVAGAFYFAKGFGLFGG